MWFSGQCISVSIIGGNDKSDMMTHLYKTPMRGRRRYLRLSGYAIDLCVCNAWILYKRECEAMKEKPIPLKNFRLDISQFARCQKSMGPSRITMSSSDQQQVQIPRRGARAKVRLLHPTPTSFCLQSPDMQTMLYKSRDSSFSVDV